jgi:dTDP-4-amino-4,6-dideoxygalactose transaminase
MPDWSTPVWHLFVIRNSNRNGLQAGLNEAGINTLIHYPVPPHLSDAYAEAGLQVGSLPIAEEIARTALSIPMGPHLNVEQVAHVCAVLMNSR